MRYTMLLALATSVVALAQPPGGPGRMRMPAYNAATETTVKGTIEDVQQMTHGRGMTGTHVTLKTDAGSMDVHLGPTNFLTQKGITFVKGDQIEVTGSSVKYNGADAVIAREVKKGDKTLTLRDKEGVPEWAGAHRQSP